MSRSSRVPELQQDPNLKVYQFPSTRTDYITLNMREAPLDDVHARRALQYATDRQTLVDVVLFGVGIPATSFMPKGALYWNDTLPGYPYDIAKAQEELAQSQTPDGFPLELKILGGSVDEETLATALKDMWSQIGVEVTITPVEGSVLNEDYDTRNFQAMTNYWTNDIVDPDELVGLRRPPRELRGLPHRLGQCRSARSGAAGRRPSSTGQAQGDLLPHPGDLQRGITDAATLLHSRMST